MYCLYMCGLYSPLQMSSPLRIDSSRHHTPVLADILQKHSINSLLDQPNILSDTNGKFRVLVDSKDFTEESTMLTINLSLLILRG